MVDLAFIICEKQRTNYTNIYVRRKQKFTKTGEYILLINYDTVGLKKNIVMTAKE